MVAPTHDRSPLGMARLLQNLTQFEKVKEAMSYKYANIILQQCHRPVQLSVMLFSAEVMRPRCFEETQWLFLLRKSALSYCYDQNSVYWYCWFIHSNLAILNDVEFSRNSHLTSKRFFTHGKHLSSLQDTSLVLPMEPAIQNQHLATSCF